MIWRVTSSLRVAQIDFGVFLCSVVLAFPQDGSASAPRVSSPAGRMCHAYRRFE